MWQSMGTFPYPKKEWDYEEPQCLLYSPKSGIVIGRCLLQDQEDDTYTFYYDSDGWEVFPTHWQPLPRIPSSLTEG